MTGPDVTAPRALAEALGGLLEGGATPEVVHRCAGACGAAVGRRGAYCDPCARDQAAELRRATLAAAYASVTADGQLEWMRHNHKRYPSTVADAVAACGGLPDGPRQAAEAFIVAGTWPGDSMTVTLLGPTGLGKTTACIAFALRILDRARDGRATRPQFATARGTRLVSMLEVGRARAEEKLGHEAPLIRTATRSPLLILDEFGYEDMKHDPNAFRDLVHARRRNGGRTMFTSGRTRAELVGLYGEAIIRRLEDVGPLFDLHPKGSG